MITDFGNRLWYPKWVIKQRNVFTSPTELWIAFHILNIFRSKQKGIDEFYNLVSTSNIFNEGMSEVYGICILQDVDSYMTKINASLEKTIWPWQFIRAENEKPLDNNWFRFDWEAGIWRKSKLTCHQKSLLGLILKYSLKGEKKSSSQQTTLTEKLYWFRRHSPRDVKLENHYNQLQRKFIMAKRKWVETTKLIWGNKIYNIAWC